MRDAKEIRRQVLESLDGQPGSWDVDGIVTDLADYESIDDVPADVYWRTVGRHEQAVTDPAAEFRRDLSASIAARSRTDRPAIWTDGTVTVKAWGVSKVNQELPQPTATFTITAPDAGETVVEGDDGTWETLWAVVAEVRADAIAATESATQRLRQAAIAYRELEQRANRARTARDDAVRAAMAAGIPAATIASSAGISEPMVYKLSRTAVR